MEERIAVGTTTISGGLHTSSVRAYQWLEARGEMPVRYGYGVMSTFGIPGADRQFEMGAGTDMIWITSMSSRAVDGPGNEMRTLEVIRQIRETVGDKPIRYLLTTNHHADHTGGICGYVAEGAIVVTHANNEEVIREILTLPHTLKPDSLALSGRDPQIEVVGDTPHHHRRDYDHRAAARSQPSCQWIPGHLSAQTAALVRERHVSGSGGSLAGGHG